MLSSVMMEPHQELHPEPPPTPSHMSNTALNGLMLQDHMEHMQEETDSWFTLDYSSTSREPLVQPMGMPPAAPPSIAEAPPASKKRRKSSKQSSDDDAYGMSNKTLDVMLDRLKGQLPPQTYEKVIELVRDVQTRRMRLSRSEFLQHFQAICAGAPQKK
jgi:hypothetical protein